ncbi:MULTISPECIES: hypothetical protein [unclassified Vibrio]|uniref:hypothetical protein n=1 Tax=unclassified Vibrio TaxID=2614977 RepID=UPI0027BE7403|nr:MULTISPECIES: hypothetical protein [unclassified Vibrio]MDQ2108619.1 hypothetical protein [Vibrio sp. 2017_1457_15]MDQ2161702.1 hypothetical protein [Vibrio sp. 2017_1457_13]
MSKKNSEFICIYVTSKNELTIQHLRNFSYDNDEEPNYIQGWSYTHQRPITLVAARVRRKFKTLKEAEGFMATWTKNFDPEVHYVYNPTRLSRPDTMDVCFTGFSKSDKAELYELAELNGMIVRKEVTVYLDVLCYGYNAGPKKLEKAMEQGVMILSRPQFETMIETGEVPESV